MSVYSTILTYIQTLLTSLTSTSKTALYSNIASANATVINITIQELNNTKTIISNTIGTQRYGRSGYYIQKAKAFQFGDDLIPAAAPNLDPVYEIISDDPAVLIIKQASFEIQNISGINTGVLKVASADNTGELIPLTGTGQPTSTPEQLIPFTNYFEQFEIPNIPVQIVSAAANTLAYTLDVIYSKTYDLTEIQTNVEAAELAFKTNFVFNGFFFINQLTKYITDNVPGVITCDLLNVALDGTGLAGVVINGITFEDATALTAGYFNYGSITRNYGGI